MATWVSLWLLSIVHCFSIGSSLVSIGFHFLLLKFHWLINGSHLICLGSKTLPSVCIHLHPYTPVHNLNSVVFICIY